MTSRWSATVVRSTVRGQPVLVYEDRPRSVDAMLAEAHRWSDRDFIVHGQRRVTFAEHEHGIERVAADFVARGVTAGDRVAIFAANSPEWSIAFFAALRIGAIVVPCNGWWSEAEVHHACAMTSPALVVSDARRVERLPTDAPVVLVDELRAAAEGGGVEGGANLAVAEDEDRPAVILFTSGTTGFPKGATLSHRALVANVQSLLVVTGRLPQQLRDDYVGPVTLAGLPLFHIGALQLLLLPLVTGARLVFLDGRFDPGEVLRLIEAEQINAWSCVPTMAERVLAHPDFATRDVSSVRTVVLGGAPVSAGLLERLSAAFPNAARGVGQSYGLSEAGGVLATGAGAELVARPGTSGRIVPVAEIRIAEPDEDGVGEIQARSPAAMDGYWGIEEDPMLGPDGWLHTGDLGWVDDDGYVYVTGRKKDMIIRGGENIAPAHVEACLMEHPDVREAAVVGLPHPDLGEEVGAIIGVDPGTAVTAEELEAFVRPALAHFEVPARWWLCTDALPKNDSGKILKYQLRDDWVSRLASEREQ